MNTERPDPTRPDPTTAPEADPAQTPAPAAPGVSRRRALGMAGLSVAALTGAGALGYAGHAVAGSDDAPADGLLVPHGQPVPFYGTYQAGIVTPVQDRLYFTTFDVLTEERSDLLELLQEWTRAAERMCEGRAAAAPGAYPEIAVKPPGDTGEAVDLPPSRLTLTIGFGPSLFERKGKPRFDLAGRRPAALAELPKFRGDTLDPARSGGDIAVQACADDPQVAVHAIRNLARIGFGKVAVRWSQLGFGKSSSTTPNQTTPRNLFGFKDGTNNIAGDDTAALAEHVWVGEADQDWMRGGTYLVTRRIRMLIEIWDRVTLTDQEEFIGRSKREGAPAGATREHDPVVLAAQPELAHVKLAHPDSNGGVKILRRGYSFTDGSDGLGRMDAGLFFVAFQQHPDQFTKVQRSLSNGDIIHDEYTRHTGSGVYACPPGVSGSDRFWGDGLFA